LPATLKTKEQCTFYKELLAFICNRN